MMGSDHVQVIDVGDLARFTRRLIEQDVDGSYNLAGPRLTWAAFLQVLGAEKLVWVPAEILRSAGLTSVDLPLYREEHGLRSSLMDVSTERAPQGNERAPDGSTPKPKGAQRENGQRSALILRILAQTRPLYPWPHTSQMRKPWASDSSGSRAGMNSWPRNPAKPVSMMARTMAG